ncbi:MAG TPA: M20/M25/M40 family metallo-hydrolase [Gemmatimonadaceae bacterium]|nr:M20/M25/M40 family metallo-hydrolase [Gemmatimonadaceae bacterium]
MEITQGSSGCACLERDRNYGAADTRAVQLEPSGENVSTLRRLFLVAGLFAFTGCSSALQSGALGPAAITAADLRTRLHTFSNDSMMGRLFGTEGDLKGTQYIANQLAAMGALPAGDGGTYFQTIPTFRVAMVPGVQVFLDGEPLTYRRDFFTTIPATGRAQALGEVEVIYAGNLVDSTNLISPEQAAGKAVLFSIAGPFSGNPNRFLNRYSQAAALVTTSNPATMRPFMITTVNDTTPARINITVTPQVAERLLGGAPATIRPGTVGRRLRFSSLAFTREPVASRNVVAIIPGSDPALRGQYVAIGAHPDHIGIRPGGGLDHDSLRAFNTMAQRIVEARTGQTPGSPGSGLTLQERASIRVNVDSLRRIRPARLDSVNNGADDDGSGSMAVLELAESFARSATKPRRSLLLVWHTGEEGGLRGSRHFADNPTVPRDSIVAHLNMDMVGRGGVSDRLGGGPDYVQLVGSRRLSRELGDLVEIVNSASPRPLRFDYSLDADGHPERIYCRSDHVHYARYGIPIVFFTTGLHMDYHQLTDEPQYIDYEKLRRVVQLVRDVTLRVGNLDHRVVVDKPKPDPTATCVQ